MACWDLATLAARLSTEIIGRPLVYAPRLSSTQALAARLADRGWPEGPVVLAEEQMAGRGRQGRTWWAPFGQALLMSSLLRPPWAPPEASRLMMVASLAAAEAIEAVCPVSVALKWPNDLYVSGRKVGGVLIETRLAPEGERLEYAIVGIGVNVAVEFAGRPALQEIATSLHAEVGGEVDRAELLLTLLTRLEERYREALAGGSCRDEWAHRLMWLGRPVRVTMPQGSIAGVAEGVDELGALLVRLTDGRLERIQAGDVSLESGE